VPAADVYLKEVQVAYVKSFVTGLKEGCDQFIGLNTKKIIRKSKWVDSEKKAPAKKEPVPATKDPAPVTKETK
jgi:hypothetical protein